MTTTETVAILCAFNEWRRGDYEPSEQPEPPDPCKISEAIDAAIAMIERLEAAEKERDALRVELNEIRYGTAVAHDTTKALNARIEAAGEVVHNGESAGLYDILEQGALLYALPGAKGE